MGIFKKEDAAYWAVLAGIILTLYFVFSDKQFSLIFTLSGTVQTFGFALIVIKIRKSRSVGGLSRQTFICYTVIFAIRSILFLFYKVNKVCYRRVICHSTQQVISFSKHNKFLEQYWLDTFYGLLWDHSKQVITVIQIS